MAGASALGCLRQRVLLGAILLPSLSKRGHNATSLYSRGFPAIFENSCGVLQIVGNTFIHVDVSFWPLFEGGSEKRCLGTMPICNRLACCYPLPESSRQRLRRASRVAPISPVVPFGGNNSYGCELSSLPIDKGPSQGEGFSRLSTRLKTGSRPFCQANTIPE
jgi:hypothetical protein